MFETLRCKMGWWNTSLIERLRNQGDPSAIQMLGQMANSLNRQVADAAAVALADLGEPGIKELQRNVRHILAIRMQPLNDINPVRALLEANSPRLVAVLGFAAGSDVELVAKRHTASLLDQLGIPGSQKLKKTLDQQIVELQHRGFEDEFKRLKYQLGMSTNERMPAHCKLEVALARLCGKLASPIAIQELERLQQWSVWSDCCKVAAEELEQIRTPGFAVVLEHVRAKEELQDKISRKGFATYEEVIAEAKPDEALLAILCPNTVEALKRIKAGDSWVKSLLELYRIRDDFDAVASYLLSGPFRSSGAAAVGVLGCLDGPRAIEVLREVAARGLGDPSVQEAAVKVLAEIRSPSTIGALHTLLGGCAESPAARALLQMGDTEPARRAIDELHRGGRGRALLEVLRLKPGLIGTDDLELIARFGDVKDEVHHEWNNFIQEDQVTITRAENYAEYRHLAQGELRRRSAEAGTGGRPA